MCYVLELQFKKALVFLINLGYNQYLITCDTKGEQHWYKKLKTTDTLSPLAETRQSNLDGTEKGPYSLKGPNRLTDLWEGVSIQIQIITEVTRRKYLYSSNWSSWINNIFLEILPKLQL